MPFQLISKNIVKYLWLSMITLVIISIAGSLYHVEYDLGRIYGVIEKFDLDTENNIPTYFSSLILLLSSVLFWVIGINKKAEGNKVHVKWNILSVIFFLLSIDESASIHELFSRPLRQYFHLDGIFFFSWIIIGFLVLVLFVGYFLKFYLQLPKYMRINLLIAGFLYSMGVIGFGIIGGLYYSSVKEINLFYSILASLEETCEMSGIIVLIQSLFSYINKNKYQLSFVFIDDN